MSLQEEADRFVKAQTNVLGSNVGPMGLHFTSHAQAINSLCEACYQAAARKGWRSGPPANLPAELLNIISEVTEASEELRANKPANLVYHDLDGPGPKPLGVPIELADAVIRICDTSRAWGINLGDAIALKMAYNETRSLRHGGKAY